MIKNGILFIILGMASLLQSCVDDNLDFPDEKPTAVTQSIAVVTLLNALKTNVINLDNACFDIIYPIELGFNNGITISVDSNQGLLETMKSQSSSFRINSVSFPFLVTKGNQIISVENETDFIRVLNDCHIPTLRKQFSETHKQCFNLVYPIVMLNSEGKETSIASLHDFFEFYDLQGADYQPQFEFPLSLEVFSEAENVLVNNYFELYGILNTCGGCPELFLNYEDLGKNEYKFTAGLSDEVASFDWYLNDQFLKTGSQLDNTFLKTFKSGSYEVCIKAKTEGCALGTEFCNSLVVCPYLFFTKKQDGSLFTFTADFPEKDEINYTWKVYLNDDLLVSEPENDEQKDNQFFYQQFEPGLTYKICIKTEEGCPEITSYCMEITP